MDQRLRLTLDVSQLTWQCVSGTIPVTRAAQPNAVGLRQQRAGEECGEEESATYCTYSYVLRMRTYGVCIMYRILPESRGVLSCSPSALQAAAWAPAPATFHMNDWQLLNTRWKVGSLNSLNSF